jgi:hypothetical protein
MKNKINREDYKPLELACKKYNWPWEDNDRLLKNIKVAKKGNLYLYNYNRFVLVPRNHPLLVKCRGLIVNKDGKVLNYPFDRFFNEFEPECHPIDWDSAVALEKLDGTMISVFWTGQDWEVTIRGSFYPNPNSNIDFKEEFKKYFDQWDRLNKDFCYVFELVSPRNRIVKFYEPNEMGAYLLTYRNLKTLKEVSQKQCDIDGIRFDIMRPKRYSLSNLDECIELMKSFPDDEEGLVIVDKNHNRMKLKQKSYINLMKVKSLNDEALFRYIRGIEPIDQEYLNKCPDVKEKIEKMTKIWQTYLSNLYEIYDRIKNLPTRKEFALEATKTPFYVVLFQLKDGVNIDDIRIKWRDVQRGIK